MTTEGPEPIAGLAEHAAGLAQRQLDRRLERVASKPPPVLAPLLPRVADVETQQRRAATEAWKLQVPRRYVDATAGDFDPPVPPLIKRWHHAWHDGVNLLITGPTGTGKTHAAFAALSVAHGDGATFGFWPIEDLRLALDWRNDDHRAVLHGASRIDVLVLDDLGTGEPNDWWTRQLYTIVNRRWLDDRPTIATTNLDRKALQDNLGERTFSRLADHAVAIRLGGDDRRRHG